MEDALLTAIHQQLKRVDLAMIWSVAVDDLGALERSVVQALDHGKPPGVELI